jgi:hypothetical protein
MELPSMHKFLIFGEDVDSRLICEKLNEFLNGISSCSEEKVLCTPFHFIANGSDSQPIGRIRPAICI